MNDIDIWERLDALLDSYDEQLTVYVYRKNAAGQVVKPYLLKCRAWPGLKEMLRDKYQGGEFRILIRKGRQMVFRGDIGIATPIRKRDGGFGY